MAVFPETMNKLDVNDVPGSLRQLENYIGYIRERVEFSLNNVARNVTAAGGISMTEVYILLTAIQNDLSSINSRVQNLGGEVTGLQSSLRSLEERVAALEGRT